jgi:glycine/D-amino acid oxidase-like deaminating enzyme
LRSDAPLQLNLTPNWHKYSWLAEFVSQIPHYRSNTIATVRLALEARRQLFAIAEREGIDFDLERRGILHTYRDRQSFDHAVAQEKRAHYLDMASRIRTDVVGPAVDTVIWERSELPIQERACPKQFHIHFNFVCLKLIVWTGHSADGLRSS